MHYLFKLDKELLGLRRIELDATCKRLFAGRDSVELDNGEQRRAFTIDWTDGLLSGRGIAGFFNILPDGRMFIEPTGDGAFRIKPPETDFPGADTPRAAEVLAQMSLYSPGDGAWFDAYQNAVQFACAGRRRELICLSQLGRIEKYQFQIETAMRVFHDFRGRAILADEVGLGKTVEAGIIMTEYIMRRLVRKILILTPASLVDQWYYEMKTLFNQDFVRADDPDFKRGGARSWAEQHKVIASLSLAKRKGIGETVTAISYDLVIVDEAHHLKNRKSVAWQFVNALNKKYMLLLSATPVQNSLEELYNLITLIRPGQLRTFSYFKKNFIADKAGLEIRNKSRLKDLLSSAMIRNRRSMVDLKFTRRFANTICIKAAGLEKELYDGVSGFIRGEYRTWQNAPSETQFGSPSETQLDSLSDSLSETQIDAAAPAARAANIFTRFALKTLQERMGSSAYAAVQSMRSLLDGGKLNGRAYEQIAGFYETAGELAKTPSAKMTALSGILRDFGRPMLVFTKYRATQETLAAYLRQEGFSTAEFHGGMRRAEKEEQINRFRRGARVLVSTETGGEGRNLQFCNGLINFDIPWNPMAIEQRIGRIHRIGQERDVYVFNLCSEDTVEYYMLRVLDRKINMFELAVGEMDMILGELTDEQDFSEMIMDSWARSDSGEQMEREMEILGEILIENKYHLDRVKAIDDDLFS